MSHTVIGIFKTFTEASVARQHLENSGISPANIDVADSNYTAPDYAGNDITGGVTDVTAESRTQQHDKKDDDSIGGFFRNLFSSDDDDENLVNRHIEAGKRGTIVTVHAYSYDEAERAADIMDEFGAVNVNDSDDWDTSEANIPGAANLSGGDFDTATTANYSSTAADDATPIGGFANTGASNFASAGPSDFASTGPSDFEQASLSDIHDTTSAGYTQDADANLGRSLTGDIDENLSSPDNPDAIKVVEENLNVGKQEVRTGGVRLRSRIVERPVEENIRLRQERVTVNRTPVDRPATEADFNTFQQGTVEMTESAEIPVISKDARVVEEVSLNKEVTESEQTIIDTVRHTEVDQENIDPDHRDKHIL
jgi:uncharacterized protein (TIGR02271 family)